IQRIKPHDRQEFDSLRNFASEQVNTAVAANSSLLDLLENFSAQKPFVGVCILQTGPSVPDSADHGVIAAGMLEIGGNRIVMRFARLRVLHCRMPARLSVDRGLGGLARRGACRSVCFSVLSSRGGPADKAEVP